MTKKRWVERLGGRIEELMRDRLWNQQELARRAEVSQKTISNMIRAGDDYEPHPKTIRTVMAAFGQDGVKALRDLGYEGWAEAVEIAVDQQRHQEAVDKLIREGALDRYLDD